MKNHPDKHLSSRGWSILVLGWWQKGPSRETPGSSTAVEGCGSASYGKLNEHVVDAAI